MSHTVLLLARNRMIDWLPYNIEIGIHTSIKTAEKAIYAPVLP